MFHNNNNARTVALVIALMMLMGVMAGCSATINNPVVAKVGDIDISYSAFYSQYASFAQYASYGYISLNPDEDAVTQLKEMTFDSLINSALPLAKAHADGLTLDETEQAEVDAAVQTTLNTYLDAYASETDQTLTDEAAIRDAEMEVLMAKLKEADMTYEELLKSVTEDETNKALVAKMQDTVKAGASVTDEEVQAWYDTTLAEETAKYAEDPAAYYTDMNAYSNGTGVRPLIAPEGYAYYKHILIANPEEGETKDINTIATEVLAKIAAGEDFDKLIAEYGEDPGMTYEQNAKGYIIGEANASSFYAEFSEAALALANVGDVSEPVTSSAGIHIIKKTGLVDTATVSFEDVKDEISAYLLETAQTDLYNAAVEQWREEIPVKKYYGRVKYMNLGS